MSGDDGCGEITIGGVGHGYVIVGFWGDVDIVSAYLDTRWA